MLETAPRRRISKGQGDQIPFISTLVAITNLVALRFMCPTGAFDAVCLCDTFIENDPAHFCGPHATPRPQAKIQGAVVLGSADGTEKFVRVGIRFASVSAVLFLSRH